MSRLTEIREALRDLLPEASDDFSAEVLTGTQKAPEVFKGRLAAPEMIVRVYVGAPDDEEAQKRLDHLLDPDEDGSISDLLYRGQKLGGLVKGLLIVGVSGWRIYQTKDGQVLGAEWSVQTR